MDANNKHNTKVNDFPEAPASWNTRYIDPNGFECQITLRGETGSELLEKAAIAVNYLLEAGCIPYVNRIPQRQEERKSNSNITKDKSNGTNGSNGNNGTNDNPSWCPIHKVSMRKWEKDGRVWYSHKADGEWCRGK
jgi:hypothetical protein